MQPVKPHWGWFLLGPAILFLGGICAFVVMIGGTMNVAKDMTRVDIPGTATVYAEKPGKMPIFYEERTFGKATAPLALEVKITPAAGGTPVPIDTSTVNFSYNNNGISGQQWGTADLPAAGAYTVETSVPLGTTAGKLAVGSNPGERLIATLLAFFGIGGGSFLLCFLIVIVVAVKRNRSRKRLMLQQYGMASGGPPPAPQAF
jgi:hypothetical protein